MKAQLTKSNLIDSIGERPNNVTLTVLPDPRKQSPDGRHYIVIRISAGSKTHYIRVTGLLITAQEWNDLIAGKRNDRTKEIGARISEVRATTKKRIAEILSAGVFSFDALREQTNSKTAVENTDFMTYWREFNLTKRAGTKNSYENARSSFSKFWISLKGKETVPFTSLTAGVIKQYADSLSESVSIATSGIYLRSLRAVINSAIESGKLNASVNCFGAKKVVKIKKGGRRTDDYLPVSDILKLWNYQTDNKTVERAVKLWLTLYCLNGCNLIDAATMTYSEAYFRDNEITFTRTKSSHTAKDGAGVTVKVPVIPELSQLLSYWGSEPVRGKRVLPFILGDTPRSEEQIRSVIHDVNRSIRKGMEIACKEIGLTEGVSAHYCRNSYQTNLKLNAVPFMYLKRAAGHSDDDITEGYQGDYTPKQRMKFNKKLFVLPPEDSDDE